MTEAPATMAEQVQWLIDRALITELLSKVSQCADDKDFVGMSELYADDGMLIVPWKEIPKAEIASSVEAIVRPFPATHHMTGSLSIEIDGDTARTRHYVHAVHVPDTNARETHADVGGWYLCELRRAGRRWLLTRFELVPVYTDGITHIPGE